jgi:hypothetical protein
MNKPCIGRLDRRVDFRYTRAAGEVVLMQYLLRVGVHLSRRPYSLRRGIINTSAGGPLLGVTLTWRYP